MKRLRPVRYPLEAAGVRLALALVDTAPRAALAFSRTAADAAFFLAHTRRRTACDNLLRAGVAPDREAARNLARASFRHFGAVAVESVLVTRFITADNWHDFAVMEMPEETRAIFSDRDHGFLLTTGHFGNWEASGYAISFLKPTTVVARTMNNPHVQRMIEARTSRTRLAVLPKHGGSPRGPMQALRQGNVLAILFDQHAGNHAPWVPFFGRPASTHPAPVRLHWASGAPIVFCSCLRTDFLRYRITFSAPMMFARSARREAALIDALTVLNARLESAIRQAPAQYLWAHRRWRPRPG